MEIGIVGGTGPAGRGLALRLASLGYNVAIGSRSSGRAAEIIEDLNEIWGDKGYSLTGVSNEEAALADIIVLAGCIGIEKASGKDVPFSPGRGDAKKENTDSESFDVLEPIVDGFRNFQKEDFKVSPEEMLLDKAQLLGLTASEMTVLLAGMRSLGISYEGHGLFGGDGEKLSNDFLITLLDMKFNWKKVKENLYEASDRFTGKVVHTATRVDLLLGSHSQLRAISEVYASENANEDFIQDFISAWIKVMNLDRFDEIKS